MLADTTLLIDFLRGKEKAIQIISKLDKKPIYTTEINVFELITGVYISKQETKRHLEKLFALISRINILPLDRKSSIKAGEIAGTLIKEGKRIEATDCLIAGIALANGINQIITANKSHYERIKGIKIISY